MRAQLATGALFLVLLAACAKSEMPAPNKNTNWLEECSEDSDCGTALECICGICTVKCEADDVCEDHGEPVGACWHQRSEQLRDQCGDSVGWDSICVVEPEPLEDDCEPMFESCAKLIATEERALGGIAVDDGRVYWLVEGRLSENGFDYEMNGALRSAWHSGGDVITHVEGVRGVGALELDGGYAYWVHNPARDPQSYDALSRVPLAGGEPQFIYSTQTHFTSMEAFEVNGSYAYFISSWGVTEAGESLQSLIRAPVDGSLFVDPLLAPEKAETMLEEVRGDGIGLVSVGTTLFWKNADSIRTFNTTGENETGLLGPQTDLGLLATGVDLVRHGDQLIWTWAVLPDPPDLPSPVDDEPIFEIPRATQMGVSRMSLDDGVVTTTEVEAQLGLAGLAADETHAYWGAVDTNSVWSLLRTDFRSGETVVFARGRELTQMRIVLSDDYVFMAARGEDELVVSSFIARFPK